MLCDDALDYEVVISGHAIIVIQAHHLAQVRAHVLGGVELLALARANPQHAVTVERDAVTKMAFTAQLRYLSPDHFKVFQRTAAIVVQGEPRDRKSVV